MVPFQHNMVLIYSLSLIHFLGRTRGYNTDPITLMHITSWQHNSSIASTYTTWPPFSTLSYFTSLHHSSATSRTSPGFFWRPALLSPGQLSKNELEFHLPYFRSTADQWCPHDAQVWYLYHSEPVQALTTTKQQKLLLYCCRTMTMFGHSLIASVYGHGLRTYNDTHSMYI